MPKTASPARRAAQSPPDRGDLLTPDEACAFLKVNKRWLRRAMDEKRIPRTYAGRLLRFHIDDLRAYLEANRVEAVR